MSLLRWFTRHKPSKHAGAGAASPLVEGVRTANSVPAAGEDAGQHRRGERMARRERLYGLVRECMTNAGMLSAGYKFKVLSLDSRGRQFLVMVDLTVPHPGGAAWSQVEAAIVHAAKARYGVGVKAVYWRHASPAAVDEPITTSIPAAL